MLLWTAFAFYNFSFITGKIDFHKPGALVAMFIAASIALFPHYHFESDIWNLTGYFLLCLLLRWVFFDIALNLMFGKPWWYYGNTTKGLGYKLKPHYKNGSIDRFFGFWQIPIKFILLLIAIKYSYGN